MCYLVTIKVRLLPSHRHWEIYMVYMSPPACPGCRFSCPPQQDVGGMGTKGKGRRTELLIPKLPPCVGAAEPGTLFSRVPPLLGGDRGLCPVQLVPRQLWGPARGEGAAALPISSSPSRQTPPTLRPQAWAAPEGPR